MLKIPLGSTSADIPGNCRVSEDATWFTYTLKKKRVGGYLVSYYWGVKIVVADRCLCSKNEWMPYHLRI